MSPLTLISLTGHAIGRRGTSVTTASSDGPAPGPPAGAQSNSGQLAASGGVEEPLAAMPAGPYSDANLPVDIVIYNDNVGGDYLHAALRFGIGGVLWTGYDIAPGTNVAIHFDTAGYMAIGPPAISGYSATAVGGAGSGPVDWRVTFHWTP